MLLLVAVPFRVRVWYGFGFAAVGNRWLSITTVCCVKTFVERLQYYALHVVSVTSGRYQVARLLSGEHLVSVFS